MRLPNVVSAGLLFLLLACFARHPARVSAQGLEGAARQRRQEAVRSRHPLYGRPIRRSDLPALLLLIQASWRLPPGDGTTFAYLIQGEEDTSDKEAAMWGEWSDVFVLTFRTRRPSAIFFPDSVLSEGRNVLLAAAAAEEFRRGFRYTYYLLLDADVYPSALSWPRALFRFEAFLRDWAPAVGVPSCADAPAAGAGGGGSDPKAVFHFDDLFVAVHAEAAPVLLPYQSDLDHKNCYWVSQWRFKSLATALYRNHTLMLPTVALRNPEHSRYPRSDCFVQYSEASEKLRALVPAAARSCFPGPLVRGYLFAHGKLGPTSYLPWGSARRKGGACSVIDYSRATLQGLTSCEQEMAEVQRYVQPHTHQYCPGCPAEVVFYLVQASIVKEPLWAPSWQELGLIVWGMLGDLPVAAVCTAVARRLQQLLGGEPVADLEETAAMLDAELAKMGMKGALHSDWLWTTSKGQSNLESGIRAALTSHRDTDQVLMIQESRLQWLIDVLAGRQKISESEPSG